mgnify:CR=1 FL=1
MITIKFKDMPYERVELANVRDRANELIDRLQKAGSYSEARGAFMDWQKLLTRIYTMGSLAYTRHSIDTNDEFYAKEKDYWDEADPQISEYVQKYTIALLNSAFRPEFEKEFGSLLFKNAEISLKAFSPEIIPEMQEENRLSTEYSKLIASAQIDFDGKLLTISQMSPYKQSPDDYVRKAAWEAESKWYASNGEALDRIFDQLVKVRDRMAKKMGYKDFVELGYYRMTRNSYDRNDVERFREAVRKNIVPLAYELKKEQADRIGVSFPLTFYNDALSFRSGNAKPHGTPDDILQNGKKMYHELSPETAEFIDFLYDNELLDVLSKKGKEAGGYCTAFYEYKAPFIFANFNGTSHDVEVITHEAGHAFAGYMARDIVPLENQNPTYESCEIHSMSMEFFGWNWAEGFFGPDTQKFKYSHLADALTFIPYGTMVDHFQHIVYENPGMTPSERHDVWRKLEATYRPWLKLEELPFYGEGKGWQRQLHIYGSPFYYIDYCLAQTVALQFWTVMQRDRGEAWDRYMKLVRKAGTETFDGLVATAGLDSPFGDKALNDVAKTASEWLANFDKSALK